MAQLKAEVRQKLGNLLASQPLVHIALGVGPHGAGEVVVAGDKRVVGRDRHCAVDSVPAQFGEGRVDARPRARVVGGVNQGLDLIEKVHSKGSL